MSSANIKRASAQQSIKSEARAIQRLEQLAKLIHPHFETSPQRALNPSIAPATFFRAFSDPSKGVNSSSPTKRSRHNSPLRVAIVGAGSISREFATNHFGVQTQTVVSCVIDCDAQRALKLATDVGSVQAGARVVGSNKYRSQPSEALGSAVPHFTELSVEALDSCDCVYVGTPPASHAAFVKRSLEAGKHVILEKPVAASAADADAIVKAAEEAASNHGLYTSLNIGMRWNKALIRMRSELEDGGVGSLREGHLRLHFRQWPREWQVQPWCAKRAEGGPLREVGTHFFFAIHELFGHGCVQRVRAAVVYPDGPDGTMAEASIDGTLELGKGLFGNPEPTPIHLSIRTAERSARDMYDLEVHGTAGGLRLFDFTSLADSSGKILVRNAEYGRRECITELLSVLTRASDEDDPPTGNRGIISAREARNAQSVVDAILRSNDEWVTVEYD